MKIPFPGAWPAVALFLILAGLSYVLHFNGLYGQDAHEYLRQSRTIFDRLHGLPPAPANMGDAEIAGGYPLAGALLQCLGPGALPALQLVSWLAAAAALWLFELNLRVLSPGARWASRWTFGWLGLALAPLFFRAGLTVMSDSLGLAFMLAALYFVLHVIELGHLRAGLGFAACAALAVTTRYALAAVLILPGLALVLEYWRERRLGLLLSAGGVAVLALGPLWWLKTGAPQGLLAHSLLQDWSPVHLFQRTFVQVSGTIHYSFPNLVYLFFPLLHPGFCLLLPALFLLAKRTDAARYAKRLLLFSLVAYLLLLGGLAHQNLRYLLPAYTIVLLLFFPAWDRFFAYGLYFFKRLTYSLLALALGCQLFFCVWQISPVLARNRQEHTTATALAARLKSGDIVYAFDLDIALQSYLPGIEFRNLWVQRYDGFPADAYLLFNEPKLRDQWAGKNPMLNWELARSRYSLQVVQQLPEGWTLYRIVKPI